MVAGNTEESSLGSARGRFLEGLSRKAIELRGAVALLTEQPDAEAPRDDLLRRLNALLASALVFRNDVLARALSECIERLDAAREQQRSLDAGELELLAALVRRLPELRGEPPRDESFTLAAHADAAQVVAHPGELGPPPARFTVESRVLDTHPTEHMEPRAAGAMDDDIERAIDQLALAEGPAPTFTPRAPRDPAHELARGLAAHESRDEPPSPLFGDGQPLLQRVLHVLVITTEDERRDLLEALRSDSVRVSLVDGIDELLDNVRDDTPDLVLADEQLAHESGLMARLRDDAQADFVPVVLIGGDVPLIGDGADARIARPFMAHELIRALGSATGTLVDPLAPSDVGALTVEEVAERVADEVRHGLVASATQGRLQQVPLGHGADVMAATFHAISELRSAIVRESGGRVRFSARPPERGPALVIPGVGAVSEQERKLFGRRILLVEDDTAIVLLLANVLRAHGATVRELTNGREALAAALHERPDLIVAGARVPELDAFALTRELAREPLLSDVPLLLLPSKEQLLTRGNKEQSSLAHDVAAQIVATAVALLTPRREIEERLRGPGHVRGTLEGTGVVALLRSVRRTRPDARICIRDPWNLFECELREGRLAQITRTACDGSFVRNERALPQLLGTRAGRFVVREAEGPLKHSFEGTLDEVLTHGAQKLGAQIAALTGARLDRVARVVFDGDAYALLVQLTPRAVRILIERLHAGEAPIKLLRSGAVARDVLEPLLVDMARRGALCGVLGGAGQDLVVEALHERADAQPTELASPLSIVPPPPNPVISVLPSGTDVKPLSAPRRADGSRHSEPPPAARSEAKAAAARGREASVSDASELAAAQAEARRSRSTIAAWSVALLALGVVGVLVAREPGGELVAVEAIGGPATEAVAAAPANAPTTAPAPAQDAQGFALALYDEIRAGVSVAPDQGLVVVEAVGTLVGATVWVDERLLGTPPVHAALSAGVHELAIKRGDAMSYRFVTVHPGKTWVLSDP